MQTLFSGRKWEGKGVLIGKEKPPVGPASVVVVLPACSPGGQLLPWGACASLPEDNPALEEQGAPKCPGFGIWFLVCPSTSAFGNNLS